MDGLIDTLGPELGLQFWEWLTVDHKNWAHEEHARLLKEYEMCHAGEK